MKLYSIVISLGVLFISDVSSYTENKCDITIWHMGVMEHLHTQETEMTQRQKSTLEKVEQMIQRIMKNGGSSLVNCGLLNTYSYNLVPEFSSQLMELTIRESGEKNDKSGKLLKERSSGDRKVVNGADDVVGVGPVLISDHDKEKNNAVKNDDSENKRNDDNRIDKQLGTEDIDTNINNDRDGVPVVKSNDDQDEAEDGADKAIIDGKHDVARDEMEKKPTGGTSKGDDSESDNSEHRGDNRKPEDRNHNDEFSDDIRETNDGDDPILIHDPENNIDGALDDEENIRNASQNNKDAGSDTKIPDSTNEENDNCRSNQVSDNIDINTETDVDLTNGKVVDIYNKLGEEDVGKISDEGSSSEMDRDIKSKEGSGKITSKPGEDNDDKEVSDSHKDDKINIDIDNGFNKNSNDDRETQKYEDTNNNSGDNNGNKERSDDGVNIKRDDEDVTYDREEKQDQHVINGNVIKKRYSIDTKLFHGGTNGKHKRWDEEDEDIDDSEDEDCYYRSADEFVCTRKTRHNSNDKEIKKIANENIQKFDEESGENKDEIVITDNKIKQSDGDFQTETNEISYDDNRKKTFDQDVGVYKDGNVDEDENVKKFESSEKDEVDNAESSDQEMKPLLNSDDEDVIKSKDESFGGNFATAKDKNDKGVLDENSKEYSRESLALKDFGNEVAEKSDNINNVIITKDNDNSDGVVMFYDNDDEDNDDEEEIKVYAAETFETASKLNEDIESITQDSNHEKMLSESDDNINDINNKYNIDHDNLYIHTYGDSHQGVTNGDKTGVSSINDPRQSFSLKQSIDDNEGQTTSQQETFYTSADEKKDKGDEEFSEAHKKYKNTASKGSSEETSYKENHTSEDKKMAVLNGKSGQSTLDMKQLELIFAQRESEQAAKIQALELMLVKLENKVLTQSAIKQTDSNVFINLENHILKLENELLKLSQNYQQLVRDHDTLKSQQRKSYLELEHIKTSPRKSEHSALEESNTSEMMKQQKSRIGELSKLIHNQSVTAQMLQSKSMFLEEENRRLFQVVLNQTAIISSIMRRLDELGQEGLKARIQAEDFKTQLETLKEAESLQKITQQHQTALKQSNNLEKDIHKDQLSQKPSEGLDQERQKDQTLLEQSESLGKELQKDEISLKHSNNLEQSESLEQETQKDQISLKHSINLEKDIQKNQLSQKPSESLEQEIQKDQISLKQSNNLEKDIHKDQLSQKPPEGLDQERQKDQTLLEQSESLEQETQKDEISLKQSNTLEQDTQKDQTTQAMSGNLVQDTQTDKDPLKQPESPPQETQKDETSLKQSEKLQQTQNDQGSLKQATAEYDFGMDSSVKTASPIKSKDLVSIVLFTFRNSPTANSPSVLTDIRWRCAGQNSTRLCLFCSLIVSNCTPFNNLQWKECKQAPGGLLLELNEEKDLKRKDNITVHLPPEDHIPIAKNSGTIIDEDSKMSAPLEGGFNENVGMQNTEREKEEIPSVVSMLGSNKKSTSERSTELELDGENSKTTSENSVKSESNEFSIETSTPSGELIRQDTMRAKMAGSLRDASDLINNGGNIENTNQNDQVRRRDMEVTALDSREDNNRNNGIAFKGGDSNAFDDHRIGDKIESNIQMDMGNMSVQDLPLQTENSATPSGAEATTTSLCGHNDQSPECNSKLAQTRKPTSDIRTARHELNEQGELQDLNVDKQEDNKNGYHSTLENTINVQTAQVKLLNDKDSQMRKKAAEEAMKTHEALYRKILYLPIYDDRPKDCYELLKQGREHNGLGQIFISGINLYVTVYCDMSKGGWTILLKREDGLTDFYRDFEQYKEGFGAPRGEHYVGNEVIHHLTNQGHYSLKVDLTDWEGTTRRAHYDHFWVDGEEDDFRLHLFGYSGDAGDGLSKHSGMKFSTFDVDNDLMKTEMGGSCAKRFHGAGWYYKCYSSNLLGQYYAGSQIPDKRFDGIAWKPWHGPGYSLKTVVLAVRPVGAE